MVVNLIMRHLFYCTYTFGQLGGELPSVALWYSDGGGDDRTGDGCPISTFRVIKENFRWSECPGSRIISEGSLTAGFRPSDESYCPMPRPWIVEYMLEMNLNLLT